MATIIVVIRRTYFCVLRQIQYFWTRLTCKYYTFVHTDPCFINSIIMLNGSWIRVRLHVTRLTVDEQTGQSANCNRGRSKYPFLSAFEMCWCVTDVLMINQILITGFVDWQSHATGSTHRWHGRRAPYRVHR